MRDRKTKAGAADESRRKFTKRAVGAVIAAPAALVAARAQTTPRPPEAVAPPKPEPTPARPSQPQQPPSPVAAAYLEVARALYGEHLTPEEFERLRRDLENSVRTSERLAAVKLSNADEPDFVFSA
jgi:hypothetical protein